MMSKKYPRDMIGYGANEPKVVWPNNAKLALQIVLNYEEGGENSPLHGDKYSETFLSEIIGAQAFKERHMNMESMYEYGSRRGFWRLHNVFEERKIPKPVAARTKRIGNFSPLTENTNPTESIDKSHNVMLFCRTAKNAINGVNAIAKKLKKYPNKNDDPTSSRNMKRRS